MEQQANQRLCILQEKFLYALRHSPYKEKKAVLGGGLVPSKIVLVGEAPGGEEEKKGVPFVGSAGKHLNEFLQTAGLSREEIYITNVVKFRPTSISPKTGKEVNRAPNKEEIRFCLDFLFKELAILKPLFVVTLGNYALRAVCNDNKITIGTVHGQIIENEPYKIYPLYHPASVIYNQSLKQVYREDVHTLGRLMKDVSLKCVPQHI